MPNKLSNKIRKALEKEFEVKQSGIAGRGLFTKSHFMPGERLFCMFSLNSGESFNWRRAQGFPLSWPEDIVWGNLTWKVNHQNSSNCGIERDGPEWFCVSKVPLPPGTEITINYKEMPEFSNRDTSGFIEIE